MAGPAKRCRRDPEQFHELDNLNEPEDIPTSLAGDSPVLAVFKDATRRLNNRQDRHERLVRMSRDITIESKRIILLLHSQVSKEGYQIALADVKKRIDKLIEGPLKKIGLELKNSAAYLHHKAITAGLQEYIEARALYSIISSGKILSYTEAQKELEYVVTVENEPRIVVTQLPHTDYMLGIADLTGDLMRKTINSISSSDIDGVYQAYQIVKDLYTGFLGLSNYRLLSCKLPIIRANVIKVEMAVYVLQLRDRFGKPTAALEYTHRPIAEDDDDDDVYY